MTVDNRDAFDRNALVEQLELMGSKVRGSAVHCPWHHDTDPSAGIFADANGHWRVKCQSAVCGRIDDVYGLRDQKPTPDKGEAKNPPRIEQKQPSQYVLASKAHVKGYCQTIGPVEAWYKYGPPDAPPVLIVARIMPPCGKKTFRQFSPVAGWYIAGKTEGLAPPVYLAHDLAPAERVLVVEGEKCVEAAWMLGIPATTSAGGSSGAHASDWSALAGKQVVLWPDNDESGKKYMDEVQEILTALDCTISRLDPSITGVETKGDIADLAARGISGQDVLALLQLAEPIGEQALKEYLQWQADVIAGKWKCLPMPQEKLGIFSRCMLPGKIIMLCAPAGSGKTFLMLQWLRYWTREGHKTAVVMFEDDMCFYLSRLMAHITGEFGHTDDAWIKANAEQVDRDNATHGEELAALSRRIMVRKELTPLIADEVLTWIEKQAKAGARVIMLDPISAIAPAKEPWLQDFKLCMALNRIAVTYACTIVVTTHPRTGAKEPSMSQMAGGAAWQRFSQSVLWMAKHQPERVRIVGGGSATVNRTMHILKCRNGTGDGLTIGMNLGPSPSLHEVGVIGQEPEESEPESPRPTKQRSKAPIKDEDLFQ